MHSTSEADLVDETTRSTAPTLWTAKSAEERTELLEEGLRFRSKYLHDAQRVFSRVQQHIHKKTKAGYEPLKACRRKVKVSCNICKADFPKTRLCTSKTLVVCRGLANKYGLRVSGRSNALGCTIGKNRAKAQHTFGLFLIAYV